MFVKQFVDTGLGNSSYLVGSQKSGVAAVIDPARDAQVYMEAARVMYETLPARGTPVSAWQANTKLI